MSVKPYYKSKEAVLYQCDNLELLKQLPDNYIDLIYCDILYNTGRKFKDYDDNLGTPQEAVGWYEPRLIEMKRVLKQTGSIYLHMDFRLVHYLKVEMDRIFGLNNFVNEIIWSYRTGGISNKYFQRKHDNIIRYSKTRNYLHNNLMEKSYLYSNGFQNANIASASSQKLGLKKDENGVYRDVYMRDVWDINIIYNNDKQAVGYFSQKPRALLERIIKSSSSEGDVVADFFMGSGTTGEVALELGRKFIGCDIGDKACEISKNRIEKIIV